MFKLFSLILVVSLLTLAQNASACDDQYYYCADGYVHDLNGNRLTYVSGGQSECIKAIRGQFYCADGYVHNKSGRLTYISGGQSECLKAIRGNLYCADGYVHNSQGQRLNYVSGGQSECIKAIGGRPNK